MVAPAEVTPVIVTRGGLDDLDTLMLPYIEVGCAYPIIYDNSKRENLSVYGRYAALAEVTTRAAMVQDDDCILPVGSIEAILAAYEPGAVTANMPERFRIHYPDSCLVGFGAVFDRELPQVAFDSRIRWYLTDRAMFLRECDAVFTCLTPRVLVDVPVEILPRAHAAHTLWKQRDHYAQRTQMLGLARKVRDR